MPTATETTPVNTGSLEHAASLFEGLLSGSPEQSPPPKKQPEQVPAEAAQEPEQVPPAPESSASEEAKSPEEDAPEPEAVPQPKLHKVKVDGEELEVTEDELLKGYSREQVFTRKSQALAEERRKFEEGLVAQARQKDAEYAKYLDQFKDALQSLTPKEPDWEKLRQEVGPDAFAAEMLSWNKRQKDLAAIEQERATVAQRQQADAEQGFAKLVQDQTRLLEEKLPEWKDPAKRKELDASFATYAESLGYSRQDYAQVSDHRLYLLLHKAMQFDRAKEKAPKVENRIERVLEASAPGARSTPMKTDKLVAAKERAARTGRVEDAGLAIAHLLE